MTFKDISGTADECERLRELLMRLIGEPFSTPTLSTAERVEALRLLPVHEHTLRVSGITITDIQRYAVALRGGIAH